MISISSKEGKACTMCIAKLTKIVLTVQNGTASAIHCPNEML